MLRGSFFSRPVIVSPSQAVTSTHIHSRPPSATANGASTTRRAPLRPNAAGQGAPVTPPFVNCLTTCRPPASGMKHAWVGGRPPNVTSPAVVHVPVVRAQQQFADRG